MCYNENASSIQKKGWIRMFKNRSIGLKLVCLVLLVVLGALSAGYLSPFASSADFHSTSIATLEEQKQTAMSLTATVTAASYAVSSLPNDTATPIAEQLADLTGPLLVIVCVIYLEKFLLTTTGFVSFSILVPLSCLLFGIHLFRPGEMLRSWAIKIMIFALLLFAMVPTGVTITNLVQETFEESINQTFATAEQFTEEVENVQKEDTNAFVQFFENIGEGVVKLFDMAKNVLSTLTDAIAVLLITTCAIPLLTLLFFIGMIRILFGLQIKLPMPRRRPRLH